MLNYTTIASEYPDTFNTKTELAEAIIWIDVETSGESPETDELLEIGACITDLSGRNIGNNFESLVTLSNLPEVLSKTSQNVINIHEKSGLWFDLWNKKTFDVHQIECSIIEWLETHVDTETVLYFGGNSITLDRNFVRLNLPNFYRKISHRSIDVTSLSIALQSNTLVGPYKKQKAHRALLDAQDSVLEYRYYLSCVKNIV